MDLNSLMRFPSVRTVVSGDLEDAVLHLEFHAL